MHRGSFYLIKSFYVLFLSVISCWGLSAQTGYFSSRLSNMTLEEVISPIGTFSPLPKAGDASWSLLPEGVKKAYIHEAEKNFGKPWEVVTASEFLEYRKSGNRLKHEFKLFDQRSRLEFAVIAELIENKDRFMGEILDGIWKICEESWWGVPAHSKTILPDIAKTPFIDLFDSETTQMMSWIHYLMKEKLDAHSPIVSQRIALEIKKRMLSLSLSNDYWWKTGDANWTTWISSNWLTAVLLVEDDRKNQIEAIRQILRALDGFYENYPVDGGCDEGPAYWNRAAASLFESLDLLKMASQGKINFSDDEKIRKMGQYIWKMHIDGYYFVNFADARPVIIPNISSIYRFGDYINDNNMKNLARYIAHKQNYGDSVLPNDQYLKFNDRAFLYGFGRQLLLLNRINEVLEGENQPPYAKHTWLEELQIFTARHKDNSSEGFYVAAKGGHNDESHNHNDVGSFCLYVNGAPLLVDLGVEQYTKKTFGKDRYDIWTMQSAFHNLPTINGCMQKDGKQYYASSIKKEIANSHASFSLDIARAYPQEAGVISWKREIKLTKSNLFMVNEKYQLKEVGKESFLSLMVYGDVDIDPDQNITVKANDGHQYQIEYDKKSLRPEKEFYPVEDDWLKVSWKKGINRIKLVFVDMKKKGETTYTIKKTNLKK